ncbi:perforin-1 [Grus americana]|uniref:perforin-1 n=1 Tax=Grus americana TaxID=9117 RepID=UPI002407F727|nr:perforin-1 [Grus americana]
MATPRRPFSCVLWLLSLVSLQPWSPVTPQCHRAKGDACTVPVTPGTQLLGWGLDVTTLSPTSGQVLAIGDVPTSPAAHCLLCPNPLEGGQPRRLPTGVGGWRAGRRCQQATRVATGSQALGMMVAGTEQVAQGWRVGLTGMVKPGVQGTLAVAGSHSKVADFGLQRQREDRYAFTSLQMHCIHYWTQISHRVRPSPHFLHAVKALPPRFTPDTAPDYGELLATYGTHYISAAQMGGRLRAVTAIRSCRATMMGTSVQEVADCLGTEVSAGRGSARLSAMANACQRARANNEGNATFNEVYSERLVEVEGGEQHGDLLYGRPEAYKTWLQGLPTTPGLVAAQVRSLHTLLPRHEPRRAALRAAVSHYIASRALRVNCSRACPGGHLVGPCQCGCSANTVVTTDCCSRQRGLARLTVLVKRGEGWRGDLFTMTDAYVRVIFGRQRVQTATVWNNNRPQWNARLDLGTLELPLGARLRVEVWDEDNKWDDDLLGFCEEMLEAGKKREVICFPGGGRLQFSYQVTCGPSLGGPLCHSYVPQPPNNNGRLYRFSQWPPGPGDGPVNWPNQDEEEEEEEDGPENPDPEAFWESLEAPGADDSTAEPQEMEMGFGEDLGDHLDEPTDAFGRLPEPLFSFGEGPSEVDPSSGFKEGPADLQDPSSGFKEGPTELFPSSGSGERPPDP